jgi:site-specific DNA recombinase
MIQDRIDAMYMDKLDGRIDNDFFDRKAVEFRSEQFRVMRDIETHQNANQSYIEDGIRLLDLAYRAHVLSRISVHRKNENCSILYSRTAGGRMDN